MCDWGCGDVPGPVCFNLKFSSLNVFPYIDFPPVPLWLVKSPPCNRKHINNGPHDEHFAHYYIMHHPHCGSHLTHELRYDPVKHRPLVSKAMFPSAQGSEVCCEWVFLINMKKNPGRVRGSLSSSYNTSMLAEKNKLIYLQSLALHLHSTAR